MYSFHHSIPLLNLKSNFQTKVNYFRMQDIPENQSQTNHLRLHSSPVVVQTSEYLNYLNPGVCSEAKSPMDNPENKNLTLTYQQPHNVSQLQNQSPVSFQTNTQSLLQNNSIITHGTTLEVDREVKENSVPIDISKTFDHELNHSIPLNSNEVEHYEKVISSSAVSQDFKSRFNIKAGNNEENKTNSSSPNYQFSNQNEARQESKKTLTLTSQNKDKNLQELVTSDALNRGGYITEDNSTTRTDKSNLNSASQSTESSPKNLREDKGVHKIKNSSTGIKFVSFSSTNGTLNFDNTKENKNEPHETNLDIEKQHEIPGPSETKETSPIKETHNLENTKPLNVSSTKFSISKENDFPSTKANNIKTIVISTSEGASIERAVTTTHENKAPQHYTTNSAASTYSKLQSELGNTPSSVNTAKGEFSKTNAPKSPSNSSTSTESQKSSAGLVVPNDQRKILYDRDFFEEPMNLKSELTSFVLILILVKWVNIDICIQKRLVSRLISLTFQDECV